ncbi:hypothetical protein SAMN05660642_02477 [Geodermatophilus siccatus]|uniref:Uncharacterized protein n=1 Tax=Geodermatophilus siccatus TaxID=1137991 RepID=A0A1G9T3P0_9ACTN|nr:hypothetical protein SAMN05660642_02477 [Geodermatophilus siccatus]
MGVASRGPQSFWVDGISRADLEAVLGVPVDGHLLTWTGMTANGWTEVTADG